MNPDDEQLAAGASGVGMLVTFKDEANQVLASLVIGKEVGQAEGQRYVRIPTQDAVYQVEISTDAFTTNFKDWIEDELLGVRSMDITKVAVRDYSLNQGLGSITLSKNYDAEVDYDQASSNWSLTKMVSYANGQPEPVGLEEGEEVNTEFLTELRTAVQDLEIVDVKRKPKGLAADLKVDDALLNNDESVRALQQQGFYPATVAGATEIFATGGETIVGTEEGVDYLLRFGDSTANMSAMDNGDGDGGLSRYLLVTAKLDESRFPAPDLEPLPETVEEMLEREKGEDTDAEIAVEPGLELPPTNKGESADSPTETDGTVDDGNSDAAPEMKEATDGGDAGKEESAQPGEESGSAESPNTEEKAPGESKADESQTNLEEPKKVEESTNTEATKPEEAKSAESTSTEPNQEPKADEPGPAKDPEPAKEKSSTEESSTEESSTETSSPEPAKNDDPSTSKEDPKSEPDAEPEAEPQDGSSTQETVADSPENAPGTEDAEASNEPAAGADDEAADSSDSTTQNEPAETEEEQKERLEALREEIARENQRKIDERNDKIDKARKKVLELNARFSEWYYVVGDSAYKKLKITRDDLIKQKEAKEAAAMPTLPGAPAGLPPGGRAFPFPPTNQ